MNNDLTLYCPMCEKETNHTWVDKELDGYGNWLPEVWYCDECDQEIYKEDIDHA